MPDHHARFRRLFATFLLLLLAITPVLGAQGNGKGNNGGGGTPADWAIAATGWGGYTVGPIILMTADGSQNEKITTFDITGAARWSPDDKRLAFCLKHGSKGNPLGVYVIHTDGTGMRLLGATNGRANGVDWTPGIALDGREKIVYCADGDLFVVNPDGTGLQNLTTDPQWPSFLWPSWAPTGDRIVVNSGIGISILQLTLVGGQLQIQSASDPIGSGAMSGMLLGSPNWSPINDCILVRAVDWSGTAKPEGIWRLDLTTFEQTWLGPGLTPDLSPDGSKILFTDGEDLWWMLADGSNPQPFVHGRKQGAMNPTWRTNL